MKRQILRILSPLLVVLGLILVILIAAQILLSPAVCSSIVRKAAPQYLDGDLHLGKVSVSLFKRFPAISAEIDTVLITYPANRFDASERSGMNSMLMYAGTSRDSSSVDTLAYFSHLSASINILPLLTGKINVKNVELFQPKAFLHYYADGSSNLDIFKFVLSEEKVEDTTDFVLPPILLRKISLDERAVICYTSQTDSLAAMLLVKDFFFKGSLSLDVLNDSDFESRLDSLLILGNKGRDTLLFDLDHFDAKVADQSANLSADAKLYAATRSLGRMKIPVHIDGNIGYDIPVEGPIYFKIPDFRVGVASVEAGINMDIALDDKIGVKGSVNIDKCRVSDVLDEYLVNYVPVLNKIGTDAEFSAFVNVDGFYDPCAGTFPVIDAELDLPEFGVFSKAGNTRFVNAKTFASIEDLLGNDPAITVDAGLQSYLDKAGDILGDYIEMNLDGSVNADVKGKFKLSELKSLNFKDGRVNASVLMSDVRIDSNDDSLNVFVHSFDAKAGMKQFGQQRNSITCAANVDSVFMRYADAALISGRNVNVKGFASSTPVAVSDSLSYYPFMVSADIESARLSGTDSLSVRLRNSHNTLSIHPPFEKDKNGKIIRSKDSSPVINVLSRNAAIFAKMGSNRVFLRGLDFKGKTSMHRKMEHKTDTTLRRRFASMQGRMSQELLDEDDFRQSDISFDFGAAFRKYFEQWDIQGNLTLDGAGVASPYFPLRTRITGFSGGFNNNTLSLDSLTVLSGRSHFRAEGKVDNLRRAILRKRILKLTLNLRTDSLDVNELLLAYSRGQENGKKDLSSLETADFDQLEAKVTSSSDTVVNTPLIVMPANVNAEVNLLGSGVTYSTMNISELSAKLKLQQRCLLFQDFNASSNIGDIHLDAFYSTRSKKDICAGFDLDMVDISAKQMIDLVPAVDTLFPLLKSFSGKLNCCIAATSQIDTNMNLMLPTIDGVMRISGKNLGFDDNPDIAKLARKLMFRKPHNATVDSMKVEGIISNNTLEVFPFILKMDRWQLALAGIQNMDKSFNYHISLLSSPLVFKFGINIAGKDFDNFKIKLGKPRFKQKNSLPVFSKQIDSTRVNLVESINNVLRTGAEKALNNFMNAEVIDSVRRSKDYEKSAALEKLDTLGNIGKVSAAMKAEYEK